MKKKTGRLDSRVRDHSHCSICRTAAVPSAVQLAALRRSNYDSASQIQAAAEMPRCLAIRQLPAGALAGPPAVCVWPVALRHPLSAALCLVAMSAVSNDVMLLIAVTSSSPTRCVRMRECSFRSSVTDYHRQWRWSPVRSFMPKWNRNNRTAQTSVDTAHVTPLAMYTRERREFPKDAVFTCLRVYVNAQL